MWISLSAHPLLGAHSKIAKEHNAKRAELKELAADLAAVKAKVKIEKERRAARVAALAVRVKVLEAKKAKAPTVVARKALAVTIKELHVKMKELQLGGPASQKLNLLLKQKKKLLTVIENLRHTHSASVALKQLYAIRKWND